MKSRFTKLFVALFAALLMAFNAFSQADPYSRSVYGYENNLPVGSTTNVSFDLGNGSGASKPILANSVEWTLNFPVNILTVGTGIFDGTPFYEYSRTITETDIIIIVRNNVDIPLPVPENPDATEFTIQYPVTGTVPNIQGTMTINDRVLPGFGGSVGNLDANNDNASSPIIFQTAVPVTLKSFDVRSTGCEVQVNWSSAVEESFSHYEVQRSTNGVDYTTVIKENGRGSGKSYSITDKQAKGKVSYRLKMVDKDGKVKYSQVASATVNCSDAGSIKLYPSVTPNSTALYNVNNGSNISVTGAGGQQVLQRRASGNTREEIDLSKLPAGTYQVTVSENGKKIFTGKVVKQ